MALTIELFESSAYPGCGPNYAPDQPRSNQLNMPFRKIPLRARESVQGVFSYGCFPSFQDWYHERQPVDDSDEDLFPPRADIGKYLQARFHSIVEANRKDSLLSLHRTTAQAVENENGSWSITTEPPVASGHFDEVILAIGHQSAELDQQLGRWQHHGPVYPDPYPTGPLIRANDISAQSVVALRGLGLSMIDVVKALTLGRGGRFEVQDPVRQHMTYTASGREPSLLVPFSLDGQPLAPKPLNSAIDKQFKPGSGQLDFIESKLQFNDKLPLNDELRLLLIELVSLTTAPIYLSLQRQGRHSIHDPANLPDELHVQDMTRRWLLDESFADPKIVDREAPTASTMQQFLDMATACRAPGLDYCVGQIWRHCQPLFYRLLSFREFDGETIRSAMALDHRMKRYAFGPPVSAIARLLALSNSGILKFCVAEDPDVAMVDGGWSLIDGNDTVIATVMINTVLDPPRLQAVDSAIGVQLKKRQLVELVHEELGARAKRSGKLINRLPGNGTLSGSGRLLVGSVFEADALICCFGEELDDWAVGAVKRLGAMASNNQQSEQGRVTST